MHTEDNWHYLPNCLIPDGQSLPEGIKRIAAAVEYDGSSFCGWQRQSHSPSVQQEVEAALSKVADEPVTLACAGRTDTGVHATNQIIHFDTRAVRNSRNWLLGCNANLPDTIRLHWVEEVAPYFHARFSASSRTYRYVIANQLCRPAIMAGGVTWYRRPLDAGKMHEAAQLLLGERDFSSFRAAGCQSNSPFRNVMSAQVWRQGELVIFEITANAFLHHMVRNLTGALLVVGEGKRDKHWLANLLALKDRTQAPATADANGLYLVKVTYPGEFRVPELLPGPLMVAD